VQCANPDAIKTITAWADANGLNAIVWTALGSNFIEKVSEQFSVEAVIRYLETKKGKILDAALNYIRRAPSEVQTPVRDAVNTRWPDQSVMRDMAQDLVVLRRRVEELAAKQEPCT
jgi:hypothetical protein